MLTYEKDTNTIKIQFKNLEERTALHELTKRTGQPWLLGSWEYLSFLYEISGNDPILSELFKRLNALEITFRKERDKIIECKPAWSAICHDICMLDQVVQELCILYLLLADTLSSGSELRIWAASRLLGFPFRRNDTKNINEFVERIKHINYSDWLTGLEAE